ncbi:high-potential iron-sulfur protein [Haloplanus rubicundus]|nr:high-potential iron-sulfur protein [Haloplanus rubicundus]
MELIANTRRRFLRLAGAVGFGSLAGCVGGGGGGEVTPTEMAEEEEEDHEEELPEGVSAEEFEHGPVPEPYRTAPSQAGERRELDRLARKEDVAFQEAEAAVESGAAEPGQDCGNCAEYIPDRNGDGFGACAKVEGYVDPADWCVLWESMEEHESEER